MCQHPFYSVVRQWLLGNRETVKFTTLIPTTRNDGTPVAPARLSRVSEEGWVTGHWIDDDGTEFTDLCIKVSIECDRNRLPEAIRAVRRAGRQLSQRAKYFEVAGYDGVQILRIE